MHADGREQEPVDRADGLSELLTTDTVGYHCRIVPEHQWSADRPSRPLLLVCGGRLNRCGMRLAFAL